jgi:hypothetical protein
MSYAVIVRILSGDDEWTMHSTHARRRDAIDQADMVHGRVVRLSADDTPADVCMCPACAGDPMQCECVTPWSHV